LIDKFEGDFLCGDKKEIILKKQIWEIFINLFRQAGKVILLDAFITTKTLNLIKSIEGNLDTAIIFKRKFEPQTRTIHYHDGVNMLLHNAIEKIKNGSKIFIFYPYKKECKLYSSMEQVFKMIEEQTGKTGIYYNADIDDKRKEELKNVNDSWKGRDFVITNNILTCGVNYEGLDFDFKFLFIASHNVPRDIIQVSYRVRNLLSGQIYVCYMGKMNAIDTWKDDCYEINCPIYTNLFKDILIEKKAPLKRAFQLFCVKAHYKQISDKNTICEKIELEIRNLLEKYNSGYSYNSIEDIRAVESDKIQKLCFSQEATTYDKMKLRKYFYKKDFTDEGLTIEDEENGNIVENGWNNNFISFFNQVKYMLKNDNNIFQKIAKFNNSDTILYYDNVKKIKLNDELLDQIFTEFKFRTLNKNSTSAQILKSIYNNCFGKIIIETSYKKIEVNGKPTGRADFNINEIYQRYFEFCKEHFNSDNVEPIELLIPHNELLDCDYEFYTKNINTPFEF
jgi:hypothetical protein